MISVPDGGRPELRVRLAAEAASVPGARRFVTDGLREWGRPHLVDDAALCVTEMAANSALHSGSPYMPRELGEMSALLPELLAADNLADEIGETHHLLTLRSTPEMVSLRTWFTESIVGQAEEDAAPVPYDEWVRARSGPG